MRDHGAHGISWALLVLCFALALSPAPQPAGDRAASGGAEVEIEPEMPVVALTFDDGPRAATTGRLLDELALREVPATFFLLGHRLQGNEELVRRMAREGHQIGVHTFDHIPVTGLSRQDFGLQVGGVRAQLRDILGDGEFWLRPPYGQADGNTRAWADSPIVLWSVDPEDWKDHDVSRIVSAVTSSSCMTSTTARWTPPSRSWMSCFSVGSALSLWRICWRGRGSPRSWGPSTAPEDK